MKTSTRSLGPHSLPATPEVLRDWLKDFKILRPSELPAYAARIRKDDKLIDAIQSVIENALPSSSDDDGIGIGGMGSGRASKTSLSFGKTTDSGLLSSSCHQLFQFYRQSIDVDQSKSSSTAPPPPPFPLRNFTLQFVPVLVETYLFACSLGRSRGEIGGGGASDASAFDVTPVETLLLSIYNLDVTHPNGKPKSSSFVLPSLARNSIYHDPTNQTSSVSLTESELKRLEPSTNSKIITYGPFPHAETFTARNRDSILSHILHIYNASITELPPSSFAAFCHMTSHVCKSGMHPSDPADEDDDDVDDADDVVRVRRRSVFPPPPPGIASLAGFGGTTVASSASSSSVPASPPHFHPSPRLKQRTSPSRSDVECSHNRPPNRRSISFLQPSPSSSSISSSVSSRFPGVRVPVSPNLLLEMILGVYHVMYNGASTLAIKSLEDLQTRCGYELFPESILLTNAIYNAIKIKIEDDVDCLEPMLLASEEVYSPPTARRGISRSKITNASFRTKQLPTDPRVEEEEEENEEEDKSEAVHDVSTDVTVAVDHLQLTSSNEKSAKTHGFKVPKGTALKSALRKTGEKAKAQISRDRSSSYAAPSPPLASASTSTTANAISEDSKSSRTPHDSAVDLNEFGNGVDGSRNSDLSSGGSHIQPRFSPSETDVHFSRESRESREIEMMPLATARKISMSGNGTDFNLKTRLA